MTDTAMPLLTTVPRHRAAYNKKVCVFTQEITLQEINPDIQVLIFSNGALIDICEIKNWPLFILVLIKRKVGYILKQKF